MKSLLLCLFCATGFAQTSYNFSTFTIPSSKLVLGTRDNDKPQLSMLALQSTDFSQPNYLPYKFEFFSGRSLVNQGLSQTLQMADPTLRTVNSCFTPSGGAGAYNLLAPRQDYGFPIYTSK